MSFIAIVCDLVAGAYLVQSGHRWGSAPQLEWTGPSLNLECMLSAEPAAAAVSEGWAVHNPGHSFPIVLLSSHTVWSPAAQLVVHIQHRSTWEQLAVCNTPDICQRERC